MFWSFCLNKMAHDEVRHAEERRRRERRESPAREQQGGSSQTQPVSAVVILYQLTKGGRQTGSGTKNRHEASEERHEAVVDATSLVDVTYIASYLISNVFLRALRSEYIVPVASANSRHRLAVNDGSQVTSCARGTFGQCTSGRSISKCHTSVQHESRFIFD